MSSSCVAAPESDSGLLGARQDDLVLRLCNTARQGKVLRVSAAKTTIGSGRDATIRILAPGVAPIHCLIVRGEKETIARRWANGARLNDRPFADAPLKPGDRIGLGAVELEVVADESSRSDPQALPSAVFSAGDLSQQQAELADKKRQLEEEARSLDQQRREQEQNSRQWQEERAGWQSQRDVWQREREALNVERESVQAERAAARGERTAAESERSTAQAERMAVQGERKALEAEREATRAERTALADQRAAIERDRGAFDNDRVIFEEEMAKLKRKKAELDVQAQTTARQAEEAEQDRKKLAAEKAAIDDRRNSLDREKKVLEQLDQDLQTREKTLAAQQRALEAKVKSARSHETKALDSERKQLDLLKETLEAERKALDAQCKSLAENQNALDASRETLATDRETLNSERQTLDVERQVLAGERQAVEEHYHAQAEAVHPTTEERRALDDERDALAAERDRLDRARQSLQVEWKTLDTQLAGFAAEREIIASQRQSLELQEQRLDHEQQAIETARQMLESQRRNWELQRAESPSESGLSAERTTPESSALTAAREAFERQRHAWQLEREQLKARLSEELDHCRRQLLELNKLREGFDQERAAWDDRRLARETVKSAALAGHTEEEQTALAAFECHEALHDPAVSHSVNTGVDDEARRDEEVFARLRAYALLKPTRNEAAAGDADGPTASDVLDPSRKTATHDSTSKAPVERAASSATPHAADDEESIDDYMARLMNRIRGDSESGERPIVSRPEPPRMTLEALRAAAEVRPSKAAEPSASIQATPTPAATGPVQFLARSAPPELGINLQAMRDLANMTARGAIRRHTHGRWSRAAIAKSIGGLVSFVCGIWLVFFQATSAPVFMRTIGLAGVIAGGFWVSQAAWLVRNLRIGRRSANKSEARNPTAQADPLPIAAEQDVSEDAPVDRLEGAVGESETALHA